MVTAIAVVFAVIGVNDHIYAGVSAQVAVGAGWLLIAIVDVSLLNSLSQRSANGSLYGSSTLRPRKTRHSTDSSTRAETVVYPATLDDHVKGNPQPHSAVVTPMRMELEVVLEVAWEADSVAQVGHQGQRLD